LSVERKSQEDRADVSAFNPSTYWEDRLRTNPGILGVGFTRLGKQFINWQYKVRAVVFSRILQQMDFMPGTARVLDVGSGTGFYIEQWRRAGVQDVVGSDLTDIAISRLEQQFPGTPFHKFDIGGSQSILPGKHFEIVNAFDVLFHIVDDAQYSRAIENVYSLLSPGGWFLFSDLFVHGEVRRAEHMVSRSLAEVEAILRNTGFEIVARRPMFVLMNQPLDSQSQLVTILWRLMTYPVQRIHALGFFLGAVLFPFDVFLTGVVRESPTTEIMICRKPSASS
jgi:SAM-dependent methyltransferase